MRVSKLIKNGKKAILTKIQGVRRRDRTIKYLSSNSIYNNILVSQIRKLFKCKFGYDRIK